MTRKKNVMRKFIMCFTIVFAILLGFLFSGLAHAQSPSQNCHFLMGGSPQQVCHHQQVQLSFTKVGTVYQSQQAAVPPVFTFTYICDGWSPVNWYSMFDENGARFGATPLTCDNLPHSRTITARYSHRVYFRFGRPPQSARISF